MNLDKIFKPKSIAIIGASNKKGSVGYALYKNAKISKIKRKIYPVNIKRKKIQGDVSFKSIVDIGNKIDLAVIATPAKTVPNIIRECAKAKVRGVIIISAGFNEIGKEGEKIFGEVKQIARELGVRIMGPNCLGFINPQVDLNMSFSVKKAEQGQVAFVSQSGAMCTAVLDWASQYKIGFSNFISIGSALDIGFSDMIDYLSKDKNTSAIILYMESLKNPDKFIELCKKVSRNKLIFVLKSGRSLSGAHAAKSHTGSLAGNDKAFDALFRQSNVVRLDSIDDVYKVIKICSFKKNKIGNNLAIITNAGGPGVIAVDTLANQGGKLAKLTKNTIQKLDKKMPSSWSRSNPVDIIGDANAERFQKAINICLRDKKVDSILVILTPQAMTSPLEVAKILTKIKIPQSKFLFASFIGGKEVLVAREFLLKNNIAVFETPEQAIYGFLKVTDNKKAKAKQTDCSFANSKIKVKKEKVSQILNKARLEKRKNINEIESKEIMTCYKIPVLSFVMLESLKDIDRKISKLKYPVAMKILSSNILHKIDCGGIELDIGDKEGVKKTYLKIIKSVKKYYPKANIHSVYIESMKKTDLELIVGVSYDPVLGPVLMFGRGGSEVELYQDLSFGVLPLDICEIKNLIKRTKIYSRLEGYRNMTNIDIDKLVNIIYRITLLVQDFPAIKELDINPLSVSSGKIIALDAKIILK